MKSKKKSIVVFVLVTIGSLLGLLFAVITVIGPLCLDTIQITVTDKTRNLIVGKTKTEEIVVLDNKSQLLWDKPDASYVYGGVRVGKTYDFTIGGFEVPLFSWHRNIKDYKEVVDEPSGVGTLSAENIKEPAVHYVCKDCGKDFELTQSEIDWYKEKELTLPKRCEYCRAKKKAEKT